MMGRGWRDGEILQTDGGSLLAFVSGLAFAAGQTLFQLLGEALIAVLTHRPQVRLHKLVPARPPYRPMESQQEGKVWEGQMTGNIKHAKSEYRRV